MDFSIPTVIDGYQIPNEICGLPVIFVHTPKNTLWLRPEEKVRITLQNTFLDPIASHAKSSIPEYISNLPEGWSITIVTGISKEEYEKNNEEANEFYKKNGLGPKTGPVIITSYGDTKVVDPQ